MDGFPTTETPLSATAPTDGTRPAADLKDRLFIVGIWTLLLSAAWSLPVLGVLENQRERERMDSGIYYTPKMPPEWYVQKDVKLP